MQNRTDLDLLLRRIADDTRSRHGSGYTERYRERNALLDEAEALGFLKIEETFDWLNVPMIRVYLRPAGWAEIGETEPKRSWYGRFTTWI